MYQKPIYDHAQPLQSMRLLHCTEMCKLFLLLSTRFSDELLLSADKQLSLKNTSCRTELVCLKKL